MTTVNWSKLATALCAMVCVTVLMAVDSIDAAAGIPVITLVIGYMLGNGVAAAKNDTVQPIFARKPTAGYHLEAVEVPDDRGRIHLDIVLGWLILLGGSIACALCIAWFTLRLV